MPKHPYHIAAEEITTLLYSKFSNPQDRSLVLCATLGSLIRGSTQPEQTLTDIKDILADFVHGKFDKKEDTNVG